MSPSLGITLWPQSTLWGGREAKLPCQAKPLMKDWQKVLKPPSQLITAQPVFPKVVSGGGREPGAGCANLWG